MLYDSFVIKCPEQANLYVDRREISGCLRMGLRVTACGYKVFGVGR